VADGSNRLRELRRLVGDLRRARNNQTIKDLEGLAKEFECSSEITSANENEIFYAPFTDLNPARVTVAIPHRGKVKKRYVQYMIQMFEDVIDRIEQIERDQEEGG
jgi:hypothetical protein